MENMESLIDEFLAAAYGEQEARRIAGSYRLARVAAALKQQATVPPEPPPEGAIMDNALISSSPTPYSARASLTTTAAPVGVSTLDLAEYMFQADPGNTANIEIGTADSQDWTMLPGDTLAVPIRNLALIYGKAVSGTQRLNIFGRGGN